MPGFPGELNQVWTNLVDNAAGAMAGHGTLTVRTALDGDSVLVEVGDTGPGVPEELQRRIFEPFFTTKPVGEGTGLGLDISFRIVVNRHGGRPARGQRAGGHAVPGAAAAAGSGGAGGAGGRAGPVTGRSSPGPGAGRRSSVAAVQDAWRRPARRAKSSMAASTSSLRQKGPRRCSFLDFAMPASTRARSGG